MLKSFVNFSWFERRREWGAVFVRVLIGVHLMWNTADNVFSAERMVEFQGFLAQHGFPFPVFCSYLSAYAQFLCGALYIVGLAVRPAAVVMILNFIVALVMVHVGLPEQANFPALMMLFGSVFLLFNGAGPLSVDRLIAKKR
jgi:putative oxidoreductase